MPILAFAQEREHLTPTVANVGRRTMIQVSEPARATIEAALASTGRCCGPDHLGHLRTLMQTRSYDAELRLLIDAVERHGEVYVVFL
jgi:hypothetical protein